MLSLTCYQCKASLKLENYNLATITFPCIECGVRNNYDQSIERSYGKVIGGVARRTMEKVKTLLGRKHITAEDVSSMLLQAKRAIEASIVMGQVETTFEAKMEKGKVN